MAPGGGTKQGRRGFLRVLAGGAALAAVAAAAAVLAARRRAGAARGEPCTAGGVCRGCPALGGCGLPQALSLRQSLGRR